MKCRVIIAASHAHSILVVCLTVSVPEEAGAGVIPHVESRSILFQFCCALPFSKCTINDLSLAGLTGLCSK